MQDLFGVLRQCMFRASSQSVNWSSAIYDHQPWAILFIGGMWFQDLFSYEIPNIQTSTAVVADGMIYPACTESTEVSFSFKNAGGWREIAEHARHAPTLSEWHRDRGRHPIYANGHFVPIDQLRPLLNSVLCSRSPGTEVATDVQELVHVLE